MEKLSVVTSLWNVQLIVLGFICFRLSFAKENTEWSGLSVPKLDSRFWRYSHKRAYIRGPKGTSLLLENFV